MLASILFFRTTNRIGTVAIRGLSGQYATPSILNADTRSGTIPIPRLPAINGMMLYPEMASATTIGVKPFFEQAAMTVSNSNDARLRSAITRTSSASSRH